MFGTPRGRAARLAHRAGSVTGVPRAVGSGVHGVFISGAALDGVRPRGALLFIFYLFPAPEPPGEPLPQEINK